MRFSYRSYDVDPWPANRSGKVWCPELEVMVSGMGDNASQIPLWGLVDIGATECIFPNEVADLVKAKPFGDGEFVLDYSGRPHPVQYAGVYLQIRLEKQLIRWVSIVALDRDREDSALWGRCGFLNHFCVTFNGPDQHFTIRLRGPAPPGFTVSRIKKA
jgi:hypothetical protein